MRRGALATCCLLVFAGAAWSAEHRLYLTALTLEGLSVLREPVQMGQKVTIVYNHSVERVPVAEVFEVRGAGPLYLMELISRDALLSYPGYGQHAVRTWDGRSDGPLPLDLRPEQGDWFVATGIGRARVMPLGVGGASVDHRVLVGARTIRLLDVAQPGEIVRILVEGR